MQVPVLLGMSHSPPAKDQTHRGVEAPELDVQSLPPCPIAENVYKDTPLLVPDHARPRAWLPSAFGPLGHRTACARPWRCPCPPAQNLLARGTNVPAPAHGGARAKILAAAWGRTKRPTTCQGIRRADQKSEEKENRRNKRTRTTDTETATASTGSSSHRDNE